MSEVTPFDYRCLREIVAEIKPLHAGLTSETATHCVMLTHLGAATGTKTSAFALQAGVSVACRDNVSSSRAIPPHRDLSPIFGYQLPRERVKNVEDDRTPKQKKKAGHEHSPR